VLPAVLRLRPLEGTGQLLPQSQAPILRVTFAFKSFLGQLVSQDVLGQEWDGKYLEEEKAGHQGNKEDNAS
jgi:hypothetical protein